MVDRLDELLVLTTILEAGSLAGAARQLRRSPPAMTRSLAALEARVGARLLSEQLAAWRRPRRAGVSLHPPDSFWQTTNKRLAEVERSKMRR
jgi:DNA-binding transcriptional LysR family regulator